MNKTDSSLPGCYKSKADELCILKQGKTVFCGTVQEAKEASGCDNLEDAYPALSGEEAEV